MVNRRRDQRAFHFSFFFFFFFPGRDSCLLWVQPPPPFFFLSGRRLVPSTLWWWNPGPSFLSSCPRHPSLAAKMGYHAACLLVLLGAQWLVGPNFLRVAVSTPSPLATGDSSASEQPNAPSVIGAIISARRNRSSASNDSEDEVWVDCDDAGRDIGSSSQSPLAVPHLEGTARSDEEGGSPATTTTVDRSQCRARARHQRSLEERQALLAARDGPLASGSRAAEVLGQRERRLAQDREFAARRREKRRLLVLGLHCPYSCILCV